MTSKENKILEDILLKTPKNVFNKVVNSYNIQSLYERQRNYLVTKYFNGDTLSYSVFMSKLFNNFQTAKDEQKSLQIKQELNSLIRDINLKKRYKNDPSKLVEKYNALTVEHNLITAKFEILVKKYKDVNGF
jgi:hypothetical protein